MDNFENIYLKHGWGFADDETLSGGGSTRKVNIIRNIFLSSFINENDIKSVYDICGDCNWQYEFVNLVKIKGFEYFGFDVSETALTIARHKNKNNTLNISNNPFDLCKQIPRIKNPSNSLFLIKEVIQHLPLNMGMELLKNIKKSGIKYLAITNHDIDLFNVKENVNIDHIGGFYPNNMFLEPFNFKNPLKDVSDVINDKDVSRECGNLIIFNIQEQNI